MLPVDILASPVPRKLFVFRHAEAHTYTKELPSSGGSLQQCLSDPAITEHGLAQARLIGEEMKEKGIGLHHVLSAPSRKCVETANAILQGLGNTDIKIKVENGLFEWLAFHDGRLPNLTLGTEMINDGLRVDPSYCSLASLEDLKLNETPDEFYKRIYNITTLLLKNLKVEGGNVMIVGHATVLEACTCQLTGGLPHDSEYLTDLEQRIPYCRLCLCRESLGQAGATTWEFIRPFFPVPI